MEQKPFRVSIEWNEEQNAYEGWSPDYAKCECTGATHEEVLEKVKVKVQETREARERWGKKAHIFKGWDWTELAEYFEVELPNNDDDKAIEVLQEWFSNAYGEDCEPLPEVVDGCRRFLARLCEISIHNCAPLWKGLAAIECNSSFMRMFIPLLGYMWT